MPLIAIHLPRPDAIVNKFVQAEAGKLSVPTNEHYYPLLYVLDASLDEDKLTFEFEGIQNGSISMRTLSYGSFLVHNETL